MKIVIMGLMLGMFAFGYFVGTEKVHIKKELKQARRNAIINLKNRIFNEIYEWDYRHPKNSEPTAYLEEENKGKVIYKGNVDQMTEEEFAGAIRAAM